MPEKQELALVGGASNVWKISEALSPRLMKLCAGASDATEAVREIARAGLLTDARDCLPALRTVTQPLDELVMLKELEPLILIYGTPSFGEGETGSELRTRWWDVYMKALRSVPREALEQAVSDYIEGKLLPDPKTGRRPRPKHVFPSPAEILLLAEAKATEIRSIAWRIRKAAEYQAERDRVPPAEERKAVGESFAQLKAELAGRLSVDNAARP